MLKLITTYFRTAHFEVIQCDLVAGGKVVQWTINDGEFSHQVTRFSLFGRSTRICLLLYDMVIEK
jgi:hypothetical protein